MLNLSSKNIQLNGVATDKTDAIRQIAQGLVNNGNVAAGYENGMLTRETQTSTYLGNGIAIPHGTLDTRDLVQETGVQIIQFPQGIQWGEGNITYVAIGIAAKSDEHLTLLRQLTSVLSDENAAQTLAKTQDVQQFIDILSGKKSLPVVDESLITLDVETQSLLTLSALNAGKLQEKGYVNQAFISEVVNSKPLSLGDNVFVVDSANGNLANGIAIARCQQGNTLISVAATDDSVNALLARLLEGQTRQALRNANRTQLVSLLNGNQVTDTPMPVVENSSENVVIGTFTLRNDNGLHARPTAELVKVLKPFAAKVEVENLDRNTPPMSAKSTMKLLGLGATQGHRLRFKAIGEDAEAALNALQQAFVAGLGESVSFVPSVEDTIEVQGKPLTVSDQQKSTNAAENPESNVREASFVIKNEHGLHARPSAVLVNEVKKYQAKIEVQNVDKNSPLVSAKSLMKIVSLGVTKGTTLRFVATGEDAEQALAGIGAAIEAGLGE